MGEGASTLLRKSDMARLGCRDCQGCHSCCCGMGDSVLLDPYDLWRLSRGLGKSPADLLAGPVGLHLEQGLILPNLRMTGQVAGSREACVFLNGEGRCSIHSIRPGICRLFPLGRNYSYQESTGTYRLDYFLLEQACPEAKTKVKIDKWLDQGNLKQYEDYLCRWHKLTASLRQEIEESTDPNARQKTSMDFLRYFYLREYGEDFFGEFDQRAQAMEG